MSYELAVSQMSVEICRGYRAGRFDSRPHGGNIYTINGFNCFFTGAESPDSQYMVRDMTVQSGKSKLVGNQKRDLLVEPLVVEKYMPFVMVIAKDALHSKSGVRISPRKKGRGQTRDGAGRRWKKLHCVGRHVQCRAL